MANTNTGFPAGGPVVTKDGLPTPIWFQFFLQIWQRLGGATGSLSIQLDSISSTLGAILYRGASAWKGLNPGAHYKVLRMGVQFPEWDTLDGNSFGSQTANEFLAAPNGAPGIPSFRTIATGDLSGTAGQYPATGTNDNAGAGDIGEYLSNTAAGVVLANATPTDVVTLSLPPGNWIIWGNVETAPAAGTTTSIIRSWINTASATDPGFPNAGAYALQQLTIGAGLAQAMPLGQMRITVPAGPNETVYLSINATFAVSTMTASAFIAAIRPR